MKWPCGQCDDAYESVGSIARHRHVNGFCFTLASYEPGLRTTRHSHDAASFTVVLDGAYRERATGIDENIESGAVIYKAAGEPHVDHFHARTTTLLVQFRSGTPNFEQLRLPLLRESFSLRNADTAAVGRKLMNDLNASHDGEAALECGVFELLGLATDGKRPEGPALRAVRVARDWLHASFHEPLSLTHLAQLADVTPSHLARAFRAATGRTVGQYQRHLRVAAVMRRLAMTTDPIAQIAYEAGFADQSHCSRVFSRHVGVAPGRYRACVRS